MKQVQVVCSSARTSRPWTVSLDFSRRSGSIPRVAPISLRVRNRSMGINLAHP
jgi:hypothetical protein